jgi:hypothetical protein
LADLYPEGAPRWGDRPLTKFERRGLRAGRPITDYVVRRIMGEDL